MRRLGAAITDYIRRIEAEAKFIIIEAVPEDLADAIALAWDSNDLRLPRLAIASNNAGARFGEFALGEASVAGLRNQNPKGVCVVLSEGTELAERQSVNMFVPISPQMLLDSKNALMLLSEAMQPLRRDGPLAAIREALVVSPVAERPGAIQVSEYFDRVASGIDPMEALPTLGAFRDPNLIPSDVTGTRVGENLHLAASRRSEAIVNPAEFTTIRSRAVRILNRRPGATPQMAAQFMAMLEGGSEELLSFVTFEEAREILAPVARGLPQVVREELSDYRRHVTSLSPEEATVFPWDDYFRQAEALGRPSDRLEAARELIDFDSSESNGVFSPPTRRSLHGLLRPRSVAVGVGSALEVGIARCIRALGEVPTRVQLRDPHPASPPTSQTASREWLSIASTRLRAAHALRMLESRGCQIDGELVLDAFQGVDDSEVRTLFNNAGLDGRNLPSVRLRFESESQSVEMTWAPDLDDVALLRCVYEYASEQTITLRADYPDAVAVAASEITHETVPQSLEQLAGLLKQLSLDALHEGLRAERLRAWASDWATFVEETQGFGTKQEAEAAALAGCVYGTRSHDRSIGMSPLAPIKSQWLADYLECALGTIETSLLAVTANADGALIDAQFEVSGDALARATTAHCPGYLYISTIDEPLLPTMETRMWSLFGGPAEPTDFGSQAGIALDRVIGRLLRLQPEVAAHFRCLAIGPGAADLVLKEALLLAGRTIEGADVKRIEVFAVGPGAPSRETLLALDAQRDGQTRIDLRYSDSMDGIRNVLGLSQPSVHLAVITGVTSGTGHPVISSQEIPTPSPDTEVLFAPRVWQRPEAEQRTLLMSPSLNAVSLAWIRLAQAIDDRWPVSPDRITVPEMRQSLSAATPLMREVHELAVWVATLDRYATRDSLERALGDEVAILHQESRLGADSPVGLVVSQKAGGPVDRAIGRSLRQARIIEDEGEATSVGSQLRKVAAQGYGILALEAATSGTGINELVGHVVGFSMLGTTSTPWPLPAGCRVLLISLDDHPEWFLGQKRADLLAFAIDTEETGVHAGIIEIKARRSDVQKASAEALDQLKKSLVLTAPAAHPEAGRLASRVWLNRLAEAAYAVARESRIRLNERELNAIEAFRKGNGTFEWAGLGLIFGPESNDVRRIHAQSVDGDRVPIAMHEIRLTQQRLRDAVVTDLRELFTAQAEAPPLGGGRGRRRPEAGVARPPTVDVIQPEPATVVTRQPEAVPTSSANQVEQPESEPLRPIPIQQNRQVSIVPLLGWDQFTAEPVYWHVAGPQALSNGHMQIWGSSGAGKTQAVKMIVSQLATGNAHFGIADFKNDYGPQNLENFPESVAAEFIDMWGQPGAPYNPLALERLDDRSGITTRVIEFRDCVEQAMASYQRIGARQKSAVQQALEHAYAGAAREDRWPTMLDLSSQLTADIQHILGDLTRYEIFGDGPPLTTIVDRNVVLGFNRIPGNGQTTVLAAAFVLAVISLAMQGRVPVPNAVDYLLVVDEAHRVSQFRAVDLMLREGRSKGLAVILATQAPSDLPEVVDTNAQTRICFRLSDAIIAGQAARKLDPTDETLAERIRTLGTGEAFVSFQGSTPRLLTMAQHYRDRERIATGQLLAP